MKRDRAARDPPKLRQNRCCMKKKVHWSEYKEPVFGALRAFDAKQDVSRDWWRSDRDCELKFYKSVRDFGAELLAKNPSAQGAECRGSVLLGHPPLDAREIMDAELELHAYPENAIEHYNTKSLQALLDAWLASHPTPRFYEADEETTIDLEGLVEAVRSEASK